MFSNDNPTCLRGKYGANWLYAVIAMCPFQLLCVFVINETDLFSSANEHCYYVFHKHRKRRQLIFNTCRFGPGFFGPALSVNPKYLKSVSLIFQDTF